MSELNVKATLSFPESFIETLADLLIERIEPLMNNRNKVETDDDGLELLDREQVMKLLRIKGSKMQDIINSGELKIVRLNKRVLIRKTHLEEYIYKKTINQ